MEKQSNQPDNITASLDELASRIETDRQSIQAFAQMVSNFASTMDKILNEAVVFSDKEFKAQTLSMVPNVIQIHKENAKRINKRLEAATMMLKLNAALIRKGKQGVDFI